MYVTRHHKITESRIVNYLHGAMVHSRQDISKRCVELELTRKRAVHEAYKASIEENVTKVLWFVSLPPPF